MQSKAGKYLIIALIAAIVVVGGLLLVQNFTAGAGAEAGNQQIEENAATPAETMSSASTASTGSPE